MKNGKQVYLTLTCLCSMLTLGASQASRSMSSPSASSSSVSSSSSAALASASLAAASSSAAAAISSSSSSSARTATVPSQEFDEDPGNIISFEIPNPTAYGQMVTQAIKQTAEPIIKEWYNNIKKEGSELLEKTKQGYTILGPKVRCEISDFGSAVIRPVLFGAIGGFCVVYGVYVLPAHPAAGGTIILIGGFLLASGGYFDGKPETQKPATN